MHPIVVRDSEDGLRRAHERTGRPLGRKAFVELLEKVLGRALVPRKRGPKPKAEGQET